MSLELNPIAHEFFNIVYSQAFSPNHDFLAISNNFGEVFATPAYPQDDPSNCRRMRFDSNVYSLATMKNANLLLCGSEYGLLEAFSWNQLTNNEGDSMEPKFSTNVNQREINSICVLNNEEHFVAAYGDGNLTLHSTARPEKTLMELNGHNDQINQVVVFRQNQFLSCSSDGTVHLYDIQVGPEPVKRFNVLSNPSVSRPGHCRAILAAAVEDQFLICGGGIELAKYDLSSGTLLQIFDPPKHGNNHFNFNSIDVSGDKIGVGTSHGSVLGYSRFGHFINEIPVSYGSISNLDTFDNVNYRHQLTAASGIGSKISMIVDYGYVSYTLKA